MQLNGPQEQAVCHRDGPCLVIAGPGSGKTAVLTLRIQKLIETKVPPENILVITFTKAAAIEMMERFESITGAKSSVTFGTFHSVFYGILRQEMRLSTDCLLTGKRRMTLIREAARVLKDTDMDEGLLESVSAQISYLVNTMSDAQNYESKDVPQDILRLVYSEYFNIKQKHSLIDFDDMLLKTYELFSSRPDVLFRWQEKFKYILVDEMQDMNNLQYQTICLLAGKYRNLFMVGDDDQSIYGFRGANPAVMLNFPKEWQDCKQILLDHNYRCPANIVNSSLNLIGQNTNRFFKSIHATRPDAVIEVQTFKSTEEEAGGIVHKLEEAKAAGTKYSDIAILYRNHSQVNLLAEGLMSAGIPFYLKDKMPNLYNHWVVRDMESYLKLATGMGTRADIINIMNKPDRYISRQCAESQQVNFSKMKAYYEFDTQTQMRIEALEQDINLMSHMSAFSCINYLRKGIGYDKYIIDYAMKNHRDQESFMAMLDTIESISKSITTTKALLEKIDFLRRETDINNEETMNTNPTGVGLYTLHSSKGLEFDTVFILDVNEGIVPSAKAQNKEELEEERRMFYVGITRAKQRLILCTINEKNRSRLSPSRFISEMKLDENYSSSSSISS